MIFWQKQKNLPIHGQFKGILKYGRGQKSSFRRDLKTTQLTTKAKTLNSSHLEVREGVPEIDIWCCFS
jgi:hypothetical protein